MYNFNRNGDIMLKKAVLIIHGFAGGTYDQEDLANYLELSRKYDVFQFTLPGHKRNLSKSKYNDWINASEEKIEWLKDNGYHTIYLIGHSMGGVIATYIASKHKEVKKLVLAAPAFHYLSVDDSKKSITKSINEIPSIIKTYGKEEVIARVLKLNISTVKEFTSLVAKYYNTPKKVKCNTLLLQGTKDKLVPKSSVEYVYNNLAGKHKKIIYIEGATHDIFRGDNALDTFKIVKKFFDRW